MSLELKLDHVTIGFEKNEIISDINISLQSSRLTYLIGKNGAGKSCLLKTIAGLLPLISGSILIGEKDLRQLAQIEKAQSISVLLTEKINIEFITVYELVSFGRGPFTDWSGALTESDRLIIENVLIDLKIADFKNEQFQNLSDGLKQKVLLARALVQSPKILLLDEPTNFLDIPSKIDFLKTLKKICTKNSMIILMSTHDLILMNELADDVLFLNESNIIKYTPDELNSSGVIDQWFNLNLT